MRRLFHLVLAVVFPLELLPALAWSQVRSGYGGRAQRFAPDLIFEDGFESANLGAWSASAIG